MSDKYLVVMCEELSDQYECDADRTPLCVVDDYTEYNKSGYEIYQILSDGTLAKIRAYDEINDEYIACVVWDMETDFDDKPLEVIRLIDGDRDNITKSMLKQWKAKYGFLTSLKEMVSGINCFGAVGDEIDGKWIVIGECHDDHFARGC